MEPQNFRQRISRKIGKGMRVALLVIVVIGIGLLSFYYWGVYDEGVRAGTVLRISKMGIVFKTYEGQLNLETFGALRGASPIAEAFDFSVEPGNTKVINDLQQVALTGERVNLHYKKRYLTFPWRGDTKYFITKVERVGTDQDDR